MKALQALGVFFCAALLAALIARPGWGGQGQGGGGVMPGADPIFPTLGIEWELDGTGLVGVDTKTKKDADLSTVSFESILCTRHRPPGSKYPLVAITRDLYGTKTNSDGKKVTDTASATLEVVTAPIRANDDAGWGKVFTFLNAFFRAGEALCEPKGKDPCKAPLPAILAAMLQDQTITADAELTPTMEGCDDKYNATAAGVQAKTGYVALELPGTAKKVDWAMTNTQLNVGLRLSEVGAGGKKDTGPIFGLFHETDQKAIKESDLDAEVGRASYAWAVTNVDALIGSFGGSKKNGQLRGLVTLVAQAAHVQSYLAPLKEAYLKKGLGWEGHYGKNPFNFYSKVDLHKLFAVMETSPANQADLKAMSAKKDKLAAAISKSCAVELLLKSREWQPGHKALKIDCAASAAAVVKYAVAGGEPPYVIPKPVDPLKVDGTLGVLLETRFRMSALAQAANPVMRSGSLQFSDQKVMVSTLEELAVLRGSEPVKEEAPAKPLSVPPSSAPHEAPPLAPESGGHTKAAAVRAANGTNLTVALDAGTIAAHWGKRVYLLKGGSEVACTVNWDAGDAKKSSTEFHCVVPGGTKVAVGDPVYFAQ
jgi:hypothetical protein